MNHPAAFMQRAIELAREGMLAGDGGPFGAVVVREGKIIDQERVHFGVRSIDFDAEMGFRLNGKHVPIKGVCMHHDLV